MSKHTKGPWHLESGVPVASDGYTEIVPGGVCNWDLGDEVAWANARLIAAAPDLLDALKAADVALSDAYERLEMDGGNDGCMRRISNVSEVIRAALAKVEPRT